MKTTVFFSLFLVLLSIFSKAQMDHMFYQPKKEMKALEFKNIENINLPVENDTITVVVLKPESKSIKKTIIFFHGAGGNISTYQYITKPLVENGFLVVMVDVRGYGKSTGKPTHVNVAEDGQKMFNYLLARKDIDNTKIYLYSNRNSFSKRKSIKNLRIDFGWRNVIFHRYCHKIQTRNEGSH